MFARPVGTPTKFDFKNIKKTNRVFRNGIRFITMRILKVIFITQNFVSKT
ncbi:hypothetical protein LEP1GSC170_5586 [Leptospira interrogans serovar Bataviae str. HAI135]|nr:hypothetical protein LEP1GSC170_5586 [Leptospira interrogans serovar Bataviae str. HAI135]